MALPNARLPFFPRKECRAAASPSSNRYFPDDALSAPFECPQQRFNHRCAGRPSRLFFFSTDSTCQTRAKVAIAPAPPLRNRNIVFRVSALNGKFAFTHLPE